MVQGVVFDGVDDERVATFDCDPYCSSNGKHSENRMGMNSAPVYLSDQAKVVYSAHIYAPGVSEKSYMLEPTFPCNMPSLLDDHVGGSVELNLIGWEPVVVGNVGGYSTGTKGEQWIKVVIDYFRQREMGFFYDALQPGGEGTPGLLLADWRTPNSHLLSLLATVRKRHLNHALSRLFYR